MFFCLNTICVACSGATLYGFAFCKWRLVQPPISFQLIVVPLQHTTRAAPTFPSLSNCLTLRPLNMVTGRPCHGLSSCQNVFASPGPSLLDLGSATHVTDGRTDRQTTGINALCCHFHACINWPKHCKWPVWNNAEARISQTNDGTSYTDVRSAHLIIRKKLKVGHSQRTLYHPVL